MPVKPYIHKQPTTRVLCDDCAKEGADSGAKMFLEIFNYYFGHLCWKHLEHRKEEARMIHKELRQIDSGHTVVTEVGPTRKTRVIFPLSYLTRG